MACTKKFSSSPHSVTTSKSNLSNQCYPDPSHPVVRKMGYLRKLKTMKKKFFVLHEDSNNGAARLEYYDNENKWRSGAPPKQVYELRKCFNINSKVDVKWKHVLALYTRDKCFEMAMDNEDQLKEWLMPMLELQNGENPPKPNFEHVWEVDVKCRGLGRSRNLAGRHFLCLNRKDMLTLFRKIPHPEKQSMVKLPLWCIRRCGQTRKFLFIELGRSAVTGAGELWMKMEDTSIVQKVQEAIQGSFVTQKWRSEPSIQNSEWPVTMDPCNECRTSSSLAVSNLARLRDPQEGIAEIRMPVKYLDMVPSRYLHKQTAKRKSSMDLGSTVFCPSDRDNYLDMASPSKHIDGSNDYFPMSSLGTSSTSHSIFCQTTSTSQQSCASMSDSTLDECQDHCAGSMPMAPVNHESKSPPSNEMYPSMAPLSMSIPKPGDGYIASTQRGAESLQDVTLGSYPKGDLFRLDKIINAYQASLKEEAENSRKPVRDHSIERHQQLFKANLIAHNDAIRVIAYPVGGQARPAPIEEQLCTLGAIDKKTSRRNSSPYTEASANTTPGILTVSKDSGRIKGVTWEDRVWNFYMDSQQRLNNYSPVTATSRISFHNEILESTDARSNSDNLYAPKASLAGDALKAMSTKLSLQEDATTFDQVDSQPWLGPSLPNSPCARMIAESLYRTPLSVPSASFDNQLMVSSSAVANTHPSCLGTSEGTTGATLDLEGDFVDPGPGAKIAGPLVTPSISTPKLPVITTKILKTVTVQQVREQMAAAAAHYYMNYPPTKVSSEVQTLNSGCEFIKGSPVSGLTNRD